MLRPMSPAQCRMARSALNLSLADLSNETGMQLKTISDFERGKECYASTVVRIQSALEARGAIFLSAGETSVGGGEGVRIGSNARFGSLYKRPRKFVKRNLGGVAVERTAKE